MLKTALIASPIDCNITALKPTQNLLKVMGKASREIWYRQQLFTVTGIESLKKQESRLLRKTQLLKPNTYHANCN